MINNISQQIVRSYFDPNSPAVRLGDFREDVAVGHANIRSVQSSSSTNKMFRVNYHDIFNPCYQYNPGSTSYTFSPSYAIGVGVSTTHVQKYKVTTVHA
jgi:hypothetical protein